MPGSNPQSTLFIGNLDERVDERVLYEIMVQAGPLIDVYIPRDKEARRHKGYGFAEFASAQSAQYALDLFAGIIFLHNKQLRLALSCQDKQASHVSSNGVYEISKPVETSTRYHRRTPSLSPPVNFTSPPANNNSPGLPISGRGRYSSSPLARA